MKPKRVQRKRTKGWRMPSNTIYVGRGSKWGNPYVIGDAMVSDLIVMDTYVLFSIDDVLKEYERYINNSEIDLKPLKGKNLACWCPLDKPCHADILLKLANNEKK